MQFIFPFELKLLGVKKVYSPLNFSPIIAKFLNIKTRGVELARYRLRKKLNLKREQNLVEFLIDLDDS